MKRSLPLLLLCLVLMTLVSCGEYNTVLKHGDAEYKYEVAKACYVRGQYAHAADLFSELLLATKGSVYQEECLFMLGMSAYMDGDLVAASGYFRKYYQSYPRGIYVEDAHYYTGRSLYEDLPDSRLDQTNTQQAILEVEAYLEHYPQARLRNQAQEMLAQLQDHLVEKELRAAQLYYDLGGYVGNSTHGGSNYEACIITAENAIKDYPYALPERREMFALLILRSKYHLARHSVEEKRIARYRETVDEYYGFANEFPDSKYLPEAQNYLRKSQRALKGQPEEE